MNVCHVGNNELFPVSLNCHNISHYLFIKAKYERMQWYRYINYVKRIIIIPFNYY